ncbi:MAG: hypothetical protein HY718_21795 [Planctomycetes bacterium]|nr:hypothetical protein [Planctomycetota bacterium]
MFKVTDAAVARLAEELNRLETPDGRVIRFCHDTAGLHLRLSSVQPGDKEFAHQGRTVLVVDGDLDQRLTDRRLGIKETAEGTKLSLAEPDEEAVETS